MQLLKMAPLKEEMKQSASFKRMKLAMVCTSKQQAVHNREVKWMKQPCESLQHS